MKLVEKVQHVRKEKIKKLTAIEFTIKDYVKTINFFLFEWKNLNKEK